MKNYVLPFGLMLTFALLIMSCSSTRVQKYWTNGKIINEENKPVQNVSVTAKNSKKYLLTGERGNFSLRIRERDTLIMMFSGGRIFLVPILKDKNPVFTVSESAKLLSMGDQSYSPVSGAEKKKWNDWFAAHQQQAQEQEYYSMIDMVREKIPTARVQGNQIYVRGPNTMRGPHPVLILVDGVRVNSIEDVNPHNVKSLELVKSGYSPTASEGSIGGVLKITTKDGQ